MSNLQERFTRHWRERKFVHPGQQILLAVSGGLDSMAMANLFLNADIPFAIAHCNFDLRGSESDGDEVFVKDWCATNSVPFFVQHFDTNKEAEDAKKGIQETARNLRYEWFEALTISNKFSAVATAHHADDNAETMLINLSRGTGIAGLHGIPERNGKIIRPLLFATRPELLEYVIDSKINYREDASNAKDDYLRNAIRHRILPVLDELMPGVSKRLLDTSNRIGEAEEIYNNAIEKERKKLLQHRGKDFYIPIKLLQHRKPLQTICYELLKPFGFTSQQIPFVIEDLLFAESGKFISSQTHKVIKNRDFLIVTSLQNKETDVILLEELPEQQGIITETGSFTFTYLQEAPKTLIGESGSAYIDLKKLESPVLLRRWKTGDYFYPLGMGMKKKKLSRFLIDQKIPVHEKENIWVLESNKRIVWIVGKRLDERFKITETSKSVLKIKFT